MKTLKVCCLLAAALCAPAMAQQKTALVRNVDRLGNANSAVFSCDVSASQQCQWSLGPVGSPGAAKFIVVFVSYKVRYTAATKITAVGVFCGPGIDWLPLQQPPAVDDAGHYEVGWGGPVHRIFDAGCSGGGVFNRSGPLPDRFEMRVHGYFADPFP